MPNTRLMLRGFAVLLTALLVMPGPTAGAQAAGALDIYFIDVEGGAATLVVTPGGESLLIDSGYPENDDRDAKRIHRVATEVAGLARIDHYLTTHWHRDHYGGIAALSRMMPIGRYWDRGIPDERGSDIDADHLAEYQQISQGKRTVLRAGDTLPLRNREEGARLRGEIVAASGEVIAPSGPAKPNPFCGEHQPQPEDTSDNAKSIALLLTFGDFQFLNCGDLTWNVEHKLACPRDPIGEVDLYMVTHHGLSISNNPVLVKAVNPRVAVMCNGPHKGGHPDVVALLKSLPDLKALYQLHRNVETSPDENTEPAFIANVEENCKGEFVKVSVDREDRSYTVTIGAHGNPRRFETK